MERVRLRHRQAEEIIAKAKEQAVIREQQLQALRAKGQLLPPGTTLLGCWQVIEKTIICNVSPSKYPEFRIGEYLTIFRALSPDNHLFGESISAGESFVSPSQNVIKMPVTLTFEVTGRIVQDGVVKYRELPVEGKSFIGMDGNRRFRYRQLPRVLEAHWQGWELEGKNYSALGEIEFKAVRIGHQATT